MPRRLFAFLVALLCASCQNPGEQHEVLPMRLGEWRRIAVENVPAEEVPQEHKRRGLKASRRGIYDGPLRLTATVDDMGVPAVAFELHQQYRPEPGKIAFHHGRYFVMIESPQNDVPLMNQFAQELEAKLKE